MPSKKHYIITSITLGCIAMASAVLIGATNLLTAPRIKVNEDNRFNVGITSVFGDGAKATVYEESLKDFKIQGFKSDFNIELESSYEVKNEENNIHGWAVRTTGRNDYGKVSLIVGFDYEPRSFKGIYVISNEQTYASTLVEEYIDPLNGAEDKETKMEDVSCGATYGAKLTRDMIKAAKEYVDGIEYK